MLNNLESELSKSQQNVRATQRENILPFAHTQKHEHIYRGRIEILSDRQESPLSNSQQTIFNFSSKIFTKWSIKKMLECISLLLRFKLKCKMILYTEDGSQLVRFSVYFILRFSSFFCFVVDDCGAFEPLEQFHSYL